MNVFGPTDITAFWVQETGALVFGLVFLFLYRQSRIVYFGLWAMAWMLRYMAAIFGFQLLRTGHPGWLAPYATFEFAFVIVLISAARAGFASGIKEWRTVLRLIAILPIFVALVWAIGVINGMAAYHASHALVLGFVYFYNFIALRRNQNVGVRFFRFSLLMLAGAFLADAGVMVYLIKGGNAPQWIFYLHHESYVDFALHCVLAFAAMAMWSESQIDRVQELMAEVDHLRRESRQSMDLDRLTGLLNQAALARRVEESPDFAGVVAVCDMDNFKDVNDRHGHLVGDEILRNIGSLLQASIRHQDEAFRWGGDEFVILFHDQREDIARKRMVEIEQRLREFRVRGFGILPITFSWGTADVQQRPLREALDEADRNMYKLKRSRAAEASRERR
ncbi:MAG TPA: diguanylate cyclase [Candidatus Sulfopaludibacter sp.]|jgi:diguanylate cyclase (GGDEF)-like protein|nr:diguanylate cyclase [Candidatus Sulfopaludibacter sp.]